jgi:hypothetical protein
MNGELSRTNIAYEATLNMKEKLYPKSLIDHNKNNVEQYNGWKYNIVPVFQVDNETDSID